jgi:hypothetical protein
MLYYSTTAENMEDVIIDLIEYAYRKVTRLVGYQHEETKINTSNLEDLDRQLADMEFAIGISCLAIIRYITDHLPNLSLGVIQYLVDHCDIFHTLIPLMEEKPWIKQTKTGELVFEN